MTTSVLHVAQPVEAGVPHVVVDQLRLAVSRGWRATVACPGGSLALLASEVGAQVMPWKAVRSPDPVHVAQEVASLRRVVAQVRPDVVVLHSAKAGLAGRLALRGTLPTVFMPHAWSWQAAEGPQRQMAVRWERAAARWTSAFACVSRDEVDEAARKGVRGRFETVPNDVDADRLRAVAPAGRDAARALLGVPGHVPVAVCVARLAPQKDHHMLLRAWSTVTGHVPSARLYLVGDGPLAEDLRAAARDLAGVSLVGEVTREEALAWLAASDVVLCSSHFEGRSLVPLEAAALGRPVVTTDVAGARDGYAGPGRIIVPVRDDVSLARGAVALLADPRERRNAELSLLTSPCTSPSDRLLGLCDELVWRGAA